MIYDLSGYTLGLREWRVDTGWVGNSLTDLKLLELTYAPWHGIQVSSETAIWLARMPNLAVKYSFLTRAMGAGAVSTEVFVFRPKESDVTLGALAFGLHGTFIPVSGLHLHTSFLYTALAGRLAELGQGEGQELLANAALALGGARITAAIEYWPARWLALFLEGRVPIYSAWDATASSDAGGGARTKAKMEEEKPGADWSALTGILIRAGVFRARLGVVYGPVVGGELFLVTLSPEGPEKVDMKKYFLPTLDIAFQW